MKKINVFAFLMVLFISFGAHSQVSSKKVKAGTAAVNTKDYALFGDKFTASKVLTNAEMLKKYKSLKKGDTIKVQFKSSIKEVCKKKGCWMSMDLTDSNESFVRFKDYGFFVPLNADNEEAIVNGVAYIDVVSIEELRHYAKDAGKSQEEINKITKPKITYAFQATGVLIKKS
ncbi:DUF4920 domain-containing protein [Flavobacterium humi]|uniref:DUF4920 domain-containing protein n=1 Tax=Flavobacterium humi TaxID=2562683 RepID=A0A4Z0L9M8_9FLAO|nr:DUF4920 domain-containing protein [Flavobacterium humi]TGD57890.1 DUF4920 domain-containing protein [Flavobacterium humi]